MSVLSIAILVLVKELNEKYKRKIKVVLPIDLVLVSNYNIKGFFFFLLLVCLFLLHSRASLYRFDIMIKTWMGQINPGVLLPGQC